MITLTARVMLEIVDRALVVVDYVTAPMSEPIWSALARRVIPADSQ